MSAKRWVSHGLIDMLIELRKYDSAAEVASGSENIFLGLSKQIDDAIARLTERPAASDFAAFKSLLDEAKEEISEHRQWQEDVFERLPQHDDDRGLTQPLRQAFTKSVAARAKLVDQVMRSCKQYRKVQEGAFSLER